MPRVCAYQLALGESTSVRSRGLFIVRRGHPLLGNGALALDDVAACPIASTLRLGPAITEPLLAARGRSDGARPMPDFGCESMPMLKAVVATTDHVLLATLGVVAPELERGELAANDTSTNGKTRRSGKEFLIKRSE